MELIKPQLRIKKLIEETNGEIPYTDLIYIDILTANTTTTLIFSGINYIYEPVRILTKDITLSNIKRYIKETFKDKDTNIVINTYKHTQQQ